MKINLTAFLVSALLTVAIMQGCSKPEPETKFSTVMECINDAKLNDRDMQLIGNNARDMSVEDFVAWYNETYAQ